MRSLALAVTVAIASVSVSAAQSLAEVARREEERRKAIKAPAKVYTNDDLRGTPTAPPPAPATGGASGAPAATTPQQQSDAQKQQAAADAKEKEKDPKKDESYWRERIATARADLERNKVFLEALQSRINALSNDFMSRDDPAQRAVIEADRRRATAEFDRLKAQIAEQTKAIADIEEEARKLGVPPGWLR